MKKYFEDGSKNDPHFANDEHWNEKGHEIVGLAIYDYLVSNNYF